MRTHLAVLITLLIVTALHEAPAQASRQRSAVTAAEWLLKRTIKERASSFRLETIRQDHGKDVFEVEAHDGAVTIRGSGALALSRGFYHYLRNACNCQVTWSGSHIDLPVKLPDFPRTRVVTPYRYRQLYNVCTFGYTTVWWDWKRWEKEIDWMALHGVSMPLAMDGQEAVWQKVWESMGLSARDLQDFFTGPAFLPWHRMGNVNGHGGPLPQGWIDGQASLQKKILARMRSLGMTPVIPAFSGFVPAPFKKLHPEARIYDLAAWGGFPPGERTHILSPTSPLFREIGARFITAYVNMFGTDHYYLADSFNELQVPVSDTARYRELAQFGEAVYSSIIAGDPKGTWVMQGWLFFNDRGFWDKPSVRALLGNVPDDRMVILDLANELWHGWKAQDAFYGKQWIYSIIHNFGGNNPLNGNLDFVAEDPAAALSSPARGKLEGIGLAPEGIENNDVVYELNTDMYWSKGPIDVPRWLAAYARSRYGTVPPSLGRAWTLLAGSAYARGATNIRHGFQMRPRRTIQGNVDVSQSFMAAARTFLSVADSMRASPLYTADAIEIAAQALGGAVDERLRDAIRAHDAGMPALRDTLAAEAFTLMDGIDALLNCREDRRLERWIADARAWGTNADDSALYEENARMQVTTWGGPELFDYASKMWSGLIRDFYEGRWKKYFELLRATPPGGHVQTEDLIAWEDAWTRRTTLSAPVSIDDPLAAARALMVEAASGSALTPEPVILPATRVFDAAESLRVDIRPPVPTATIRYTLDGTEPTAQSARYTGPFRVGGDVTVSARAFGQSGFPSFTVSRAYFAVHKGINGLSYRYYEGEWRDLPDFDTVAVARRGIVYTLSLDDIPNTTEYFGVEYGAYLEITAPGAYTFVLGSDDGSRLLVDGKLVVDNGGLHGYAEKEGRMTLGAGKHSVTVRYIQQGGAKRVELRYAGPGVSEQSIPPAKWSLTK
ncbi:MAG TPA: alpha-N-acetylglucosaminidase TIM-barrel domain-containing protein [Bacteroidota bacterium]|nr:alpha-N-acetylglucosaminidase TIM-barrel domain-containing protein [Bacteroidota bacterium]